MDLPLCEGWGVGIFFPVCVLVVVVCCLEQGRSRCSFPFAVFATHIFSWFGTEEDTRTDPEDDDVCQGENVSPS